MKIIDVPRDILTLLAKEGGAEAPWGSPEPIQHNSVPVQPFTPDLLPESLRPWVTDITRRMQCPLDFTAVAAVVMLGSVIGSGCAVRPKQRDDWTVVPNLWGAAIGRPGRLKSPAIASAMAPLYRLDKLAQEDWKAAMAVHQQAVLTNKMTAELLKKKVSSDKDLDPKQPSADFLEYQRISGLSLDEPKPKRYHSNDCTIESLGELLQTNPRGILVEHDELTGLLAGFERPGREGERQGYLTAWNGTGSHRVDRIGRGNILIERFCASIFGGIQPDKLELYLADAQYNHGNDGFIQRLQLMVYPDEVPTVSIVDQSPDDAAADTVMKIVLRLAKDIESAGAKQDYDYEIPYFRFEIKKAQPLFFKWLTTLTERITTEDNTLMQEHLGKYRKLVPALALIFHLVEMAGEKVKQGSAIGIKSLELAIRWSDYLESHARRVYAMATDYKIQAAQLLGTKITRKQLEAGFSARDIIRKGWSRLTDLDEVKAACDELEAANWIRRKPTEVKRPGRPALPTYDINPAVFTFTHAGDVPTKPTKRKR
jgi:hypothetical protein